MQLSSRQKALLVSSSASYTFWGIVATIGPLAASGSIVGHVTGALKVFLLLIGPIFAPIGNFTMGFLADMFGRKRVFVVTMLSYTIGIIIVAASSTVWSLVPGLMLAQFGVGGEESPSLSLIAEDSPVSKRAKYLTLVANFSNIGSALISGLFLITSSSLFDRLMLLGSSLAMVGVMVYSRLSIPESYRWLSSVGRERDASEEKAHLSIDEEGTKAQRMGVPFIYATLVLIGISQYLTFGLMAYVIGPYEFPSTAVDNEIIFVALLGASVAGFAAAPLINRERKSYTLYSYLAGVVSMVAIFLTVPYLHDMDLFLPLLFVNMATSEFGWASRTTLEPELFPTRVRARSIGMVRLAPMIAYAIFTYATSSLNLGQFILVNLILWAIGLAGAAIWYFFGYETRGIDIDYGAGQAQ
ncbi:MFS transporter [Thermogymnomonas acidicola]|uniref:MFS transporter n=1 Tax=Thermogymnomonas acidicola TaxID=399579 RepID=A0AA37BRQ7_9ARCH|nr:MFS transporter [Thermogymnomonas acidicola]GGM74590.1 MFS transporter [Thermogymnomonas acidicola]